MITKFNYHKKYSKIFGNLLVILKENTVNILLLISFMFLISTKINKNFSEYTRTQINKLSYPIIERLYHPLKYIVNIIIFTNNSIWTYKDNKFFKKEISELKYQIASCEKLEQENKELKNLLQYRSNKNFKQKTAQAFIYGTSPFSAVFIIDIGKNDNVSAGQAVVSQDSFIGRALNVYKNYSTIMLINNINSHIPVIGSSSRQRAIMIGYNNDSLLLKYLPEENNHLTDGELIITSGDGHMLPYGLPIGTVKKHGKKYYVESLSDLNKIRFINILVPKKSK